MTPSGAWRIDVTRDVAEQLRGLPVVVRGAVADVLDDLERHGLPTDARAGATAPDTWAVPVPGDATLHVVVRASDRTLLVFRVDPPAVRDDVVVRVGGRSLERLREGADEVRLALRSLRRAPAFTLGLVLTLAVGLGGTATILGLAHTVFRGALPFADGDRVVRVRSSGQGSGGEPFYFNVTPRDFHLLRDGNRVFSGIVAQRGNSLILAGDGPALRASAIGVTAGWSQLLGVRPVLGRTFTPDEEAAGAASAVALLSHGLWESRYGGDPDVVGRDIAYDGGSYRVVGVMPPRFAYPYDADLWTPWRADPTDWISSGLNVVARLSPEVDVEQAGADADRLYAQLRAEQPGVTPNQGFNVVAVREDFIRTQAAALKALLLAVGCLLLLVCVNVANLFVARRAGQKRELAVRSALGAGRGRLTAGAVLEMVLVFVIGGGLGLLLVGPLSRSGAILIPDVLRTQLDLAVVPVGPTVLAMLGVSLVAGGLTGLLGARSVGRAGLSTILRDGGRGSSGGRFGRLRDALIVSELALSLVLLVGAGLLAGHFQRLQTADLGFDAEGVVTAQVALEQERFTTPDARAQVVLALQDALGALPSVRAVGATSVNPLCCGDWGARVRIDGLDRPADAPPITIHHRYVTPEYFGALGVTVTAGRSFNAADAVGTAPTVIIDEDLAARFWPGETAIGQRIGFEREGAELRTIVGVASRAHTEGDRRETWYLPMLQDPTGRSNEIVHLMIRGDVDATSIRTAVATVDAGLAVFGVSRMDDLRSERLAQDRLGAVVTGAFALAGLLLATIGLYGLLAYQIELQRRELGTRMALGARGADIRTMVLARTGRLLALGLTIGLVLSVWLSRIVVGFVDGVEPATPLLLLGLSGVLALAAAVATVVPVRRAVSADPASVLQDA